MSTYPLSIRFDASVIERLRRWARSHTTTPSGLVQDLVDEGLRMRETPGIIFKPGPSGRRASLAGGPDVWEIMAAVKETPAEAGDKVASVAEEMGLPASLVDLALTYYSRYPAEIDREIADNELAAEAAFKAWQVRQAALS
ncbi:MAG: hypothetical protein LBR33_05655 [Propionibacteriaceae bacterium]|jgi:hypothetical protein|nr:hypothetical protein [Propionibacteriaceae bacterium]